MYLIHMFLSYYNKYLLEVLLNSSVYHERCIYISGEILNLLYLELKAPFGYVHLRYVGVSYMYKNESEFTMPFFI